MAGKIIDSPFTSGVDFRCPSCAHTWRGVPSRTAEAPDDWWHPFAYWADCPECDTESAQERRQWGLWKAHAHATGPRTPEGKAASSANLDGHPTPEEARITRFNAITHGNTAKVAEFYPAKPGKYPHCTGCSYYSERPNGESPCVERPGTTHRNPPACLKRAELFVRHQVAFQSGDPKLLAGLRAETHAGLQAIIDDMILAIAQGGVELKTPQWYSDKDGGFHLARYRDDVTGEFIQLMDVKQHPLLKPLIDYVAKNSMTLADQNMTPKAVDEDEVLRGQLADDETERDSAEAHRQAQTAMLEKLTEQIERSQRRTAKDTVLVEYQQGEPGNG